MSEVQQQGADIPMTIPISISKDLDVPISSRRGHLKKPFRYCEKTIVVIHEEIVNRLGINDETWFEQEVTATGILLKIASLTEIGEEK